MRKVVWTGLAITLCLAVVPPDARAQSMGTCLAISNAYDGQAVSITVDGWGSGTWDFAPYEGISGLSVHGERIHSGLSNGTFTIHWTGSHIVSWQWEGAYTGENGGQCAGEWVGYIH
jgi:hypothetical protein